MKNTLVTSFFLIVISSQLPAQSAFRDSLSSDSGMREFLLASIRIDGEVEKPGNVDLNALPLRSVRLKELIASDTGRQQFKGAFLYAGYSLYDILSTTKLKKANEKEFSPSTDLYVIVENEKGERAVFSWGEIFYAKNTFQILVAKSVKAINPSKVKATWTIPTGSRLVCADDFTNIRFVSEPTKLIVRSFVDSFPAEESKELYSPDIMIVRGSRSLSVGEIKSSVELRTYTSVGYGHGMGYKGVQSVVGYVLKNVLNSLKLDQIDMRESIAVVSAKDGYRAVFSASEIFNRNDNQDLLLIDQKESRKDGRYSLFATPDFFVDRNVKAIDKIEIARIE